MSENDSPGFKHFHDAVLDQVRIIWSTGQIMCAFGLKAARGKEDNRTLTVSDFEQLYLRREFPWGPSEHTKEVKQLQCLNEDNCALDIQMSSGDHIEVFSEAKALENQIHEAYLEPREFGNWEELQSCGDGKLAELISHSRIAHLVLYWKVGVLVLNLKIEDSIKSVFLTGVERLMVSRRMFEKLDLSGVVEKYSILEDSLEAKTLRHSFRSSGRSSKLLRKLHLRIASGDDIEIAFHDILV